MWKFVQENHKYILVNKNTRPKFQSLFHDNVFRVTEENKT